MIHDIEDMLKHSEELETEVGDDKEAYDGELDELLEDDDTAALFSEDGLCDCGARLNGENKCDYCDYAEELDEDEEDESFEELNFDR